MDQAYYLERFQRAAGRLRAAADGSGMAGGLTVDVSVVLNSVALKIYSPAWIAEPARIFFSIWLSPIAIAEGRLLYNIHALKLRHFKGYTIASREFARAFRERFDPAPWPNVRTTFGPLTLMEGWVPLQQETLEDDMTALGRRFLDVAPLIDDTLRLFADPRPQKRPAKQ